MESHRRPGKKATVLERREECVMIKITKTEKAAWKAAAQKDGRTVSDWGARRINGQSATAPTRRLASSPRRRPVPASHEPQAAAILAPLAEGATP